MIELEPVNRKTFEAVVDMRLPPEQNCFVAPNVVSLAQAWLEYDAARPYAILNDGQVVGFIMLDCDRGERSVGIWRFMIAHEHQHRGYGRQALERVISMIRDDEGYDMIYLDYVEGNTVARSLYYSLGFRENGKVEDGEIIMTLPLTDNPKTGMLIADEDDADDIAALLAAEASNGATIPAVLSEHDSLIKELEKGAVVRITLMGETIGVAYGSVIIIEHGNADRLCDAVALLSASAGGGV